MLPSSSIAALFLLSLVPGFVFIRASERSRKPRSQSSLLELLEVVAVGVGTTGVAALVWVLVWPDGVYDTLSSRPTTGGELRIQLGLVAVILAMAVGLALVLAFAFERGTKDRFSLSVWQGTLARELVPKDHMPHLMIELLDNTQVDGVLADYTMAVDANHRDIALKAPIAVTYQGNRHEPLSDALIVPGDQIRYVTLKYWPDPKPTAPPPDDSPEEGTPEEPSPRRNLAGGRWRLGSGRRSPTTR